MSPELLDEMRAALALCAFLPAHPHKRFARQVAAIPLDQITEAQRRHIIRLAWRYRRSMPPHLIPSKDAVMALDAEDSVRRAAARRAGDARKLKRELMRHPPSPQAALDLPVDFVTTIKAGLGDT